MSDAIVLETNRVYDGKMLKVDRESVRLPNGAVANMVIVRHPGASAVVPYHADGTVTLLRQYRHAVGRTIIEIPAGKIDPGDTPESCAARELIEEVGLSTGRLLPLGAILTSPGFTDELIHLYVAMELSEVAAAPEEDEVLDAYRVPLKDALAMVASGEINDAKSQCALLRLHQEMEAGRILP